MGLPIAHKIKRKALNWYTLDSLCLLSSMLLNLSEIAPLFVFSLFLGVMYTFFLHIFNAERNFISATCPLPFFLASKSTPTLSALL